MVINSEAGRRIIVLVATSPGMVALGCPLVVVQLPCGWVFAAPAGPAVRWSLFMSCVGPRARAVRAEAAFCRGRLGADCSVRGCRERIRARPTLLCVSLLVLWERKSQFMTRGSTVQSWPASSLRFCLGALRTAVINPKRQNLLHRTVQRRYIPRSCNGSTKRSLYEPLSSHLLHRRVAVLRNGRERHEALRTQC